MTDAPHFTPREGQVDFHHIRWAPVMNIALMHGEEYLVVKRSETMNFYPGLWNGISGFIDDGQSLDEKVREELREELGLKEEAILSIELRGIFDQEAPELGKTWIVHAIKATVQHKEITLDWEASEHRWLTGEEYRTLELVPGFATVLDLVLHEPNRVTRLPG